MKNHAKGLGYFFIFVLLCFSSETFGQRRKRFNPPKAPRSAYLPLATDNLPADKKLRVETFEKVWRTIFYYYFDGKFNNVDWASLKFEFEPRVRAATTDEELHSLLESMLGRLKASHLAIIRPAVYETIETAKEMARARAAERGKPGDLHGGASPIEETTNFDDALAVYGPGIEIRTIGDKFVVFRVLPGSAAEYRGIKPGFVIETIDEVSLSLLYERVKMLDKGDSRVRRYLPFQVVSEMLNGEKDSTVKIGYLDATDKKEDIVIRRELLRTSTVSMGPNYPELQLTFQARSLDDKTGYIYFDNFSLPVIQKFCDAIEQFRSKPALIIDLRGNTGGVIGVSIALAGMLSDRPIDLGTSIYRYGAEPMIANSKPKNFKGRIVILTDELSVSAAELFAASMQAAGRAKIIGAKSAGESLPSVTVELPTGARLLYPIANFRTAAGKFLEGDGVTPDGTVLLDRQSLLNGHDPQLTIAISELRAPEAKPVVGNGDPLSAPGPPNSVPAGRSTAVSPPPPPPPPKQAREILAAVTIKAPAPPAEKPDKIEPKAVELIIQSEKLSGGYAAYAAISNYELTGTVDTVAMGSRNTQEYRSYKEGNERQLLILTSPATGEVRNYRDGKSMKLKSDLGIDIETPYEVSIEESDFLYSIMRSMKTDNYKKLLYLGIFDRNDRKVHLIDGETKEGVTVAIYFDAVTNLLAGFEGPNGGLSFGDYRKIGDVMFPFNISSQDFLNIKLTDVKLNTKIDPSVFERKLSCFDKPTS